MNEPLIPGPELPAEAAAKETVLADLRAAFAKREQVGWRSWGIGLDDAGYWRPTAEERCCPIARQIVGSGTVLPGFDPQNDAALRLGVDRRWIAGFVHAWDREDYHSGGEERPYFWGFAAGMAAREIEPKALDGRQVGEGGEG